MQGYKNSKENVLYNYYHKEIMNIAESINHYSLPSEIALRSGLKLHWIKKAQDVEIFEFRDGNNKRQNIGDEADYLQLYMRLAEKLYQKQSNSFGTYLLASNSNGKRLFLKEFTAAEQSEVKYGYISLLRSSKMLDKQDLEGSFSFYSEIILEKANHKNFERQSPKVAKILKNQNREAWLEIQKNQYDFLKADLYIFSLQKLHSWGFQAIGSDGKLMPTQQYVRAIKPKPRGAKLK